MANVNIVELTIEKIDEVKSKLGRTLGASMRLRDLIRQVRAARTAAEERAVVEKESANIRDSFRDEQDKYKCRNMAKLLYIHMLGYPAHFGQMETVKLVGTKDKRFTDIRIGYLGAMLLLDERSEVHLLVTNCLKSHLNESDQFVTGLALCTLGSICSAEMCRDLAGEVEKLLIKSTNTYIKKKAALCAHRIVRKAPELIEMFISSTRSLLNEKHHGVLMGGITLVSEMCELSTDVRTHFKRMVPNLVRILKNLLMTGYSPEHDVSGISDPFLQVKILKLLRILGRDDPRTSEEMNDILAQVATNTETSKNVGNAILYETVLTIMEISSESGLRVLGINILGRFLLNPDKNIRYVALNTLLKTVNVDFQAVQRHRTTVVECLKDQDVSIRKRAMELSFALINKTNITNMSKEILIFLETADPEFKAECASKMYVATERYSPSFVWHLDTMVSVLKLAGNHVPDEIAFWCVGEFGDLLVSAPEQELGSPSHRYPVNGKQVEESEVVEMFEKLMPCNAMTIPTREYGLTSLAKLVTRFETCAERIRALIRTYTAHMNLELQQRSVEYAQLLRKDELKYGLLERMPTISHNALRDNSSAAVRLDGGNEGVIDESGTGGLPPSSDNLLFSTDDDPIATGSTLASAPVPPTGGLNDVSGDLFDFIGLNNGGASAAPKGGSNVDRGQNTLLDLDDLMGGGSANNNQQTADMNFGGLFDVGELAAKATPSSGQASIVAVNKSGIEVQIRVESTFSESEGSPQEAMITLLTTNNNPVPIDSYAFQAAVTKAYQIELLPASGLTLEANAQSTITQKAKIRRISHGQALRLRVKINYAMDGRPLTIQQDVEKLPGL